MFEDEERLERAHEEYKRDLDEFSNNLNEVLSRTQLFSRLSCYILGVIISGAAIFSTAFYNQAVKDQEEKRAFYGETLRGMVLENRAYQRKLKLEGEVFRESIQGYELDQQSESSE